MEKDELVQLAKNLMMEVLYARSYKDIIDQYRTNRTTYNREINLSSAFYGISEMALVEALSIRLARLYDADERSAGLGFLMQQAEAHTEFFPKDRGEHSFVSEGKVYKYTLFISLPCAVGMGVLSYRVLSVVFPSQSAYLGAPMLTVLSPSVVLCALLAVSDTVLQSCGKPSYPLISMICGASVKLISTFILFKSTPLGRLSIPLGTCLCYLTAVVINAVLSHRRCGITPYYKSVVKPAFCAAVSGAFAYIVNRYAVLYLTETVSTIVTILLTCSLYLTFIKLTNYIDKSELYNLLNKKEDRKNGGIQKKREIRV